MSTLRKLLVVVLCSGALGGLVLFAIQHFTIVPLIEAAERYENETDHHGDEWKPDSGTERTVWTAVTTVLTGIGLAAVLFGFLSLMGRNVTMRKGVLWGTAAFVCFHLAPSFGMPPLPPGVPVSDVESRQVWWVCAVSATAAGLWLLSGTTWTRRIAGTLSIAMPHLIGAPVRAGESAVPAELMRSFAIVSLVTAAIFWVTLGAIGGYLSSRDEA